MEERLLEAKGFLVVAFFQYGSVPCRHFLPQFAALKNVKEEVEFLAVEVTENPLITEACQVEDVPTTVVFLNGNEIKRWEGPYNTDTLERRISELKKKAS